MPETYTPIAVIGASCRLPGGLESIDSLWSALVDRLDLPSAASRGEALIQRLSGAGAAVPSGPRFAAPGDFDPEFFGISPREAPFIDPQQRLLLEVVWQALEHAGLPPYSLSGSLTGVFTGVSNGGYYDGYTRAPDGYEVTGSVMSGASGRISYLLDIHGPSVSVDTACSSGLVATHQAAQSLHTGESDLALACGVNLIFGRRLTDSLHTNGMLAPSGTTSAFDTDASGFVRSEGCGVVVLKRLCDAESDGDRVLAVIRGSAVNSDGTSPSLMAPTAAGQQAAARSALAHAGIDPARVGLVEAHGTGTPVGDPIEFAALNSVYGDGPGRCALGAVKSNTGHTEEAAGIIGLIKTVLCLRTGEIPPNIGFTSWNPRIDPTGSRLFVPTEHTTWPIAHGTRLAAVSATGITGTNAHVVLEQAPAARAISTPETATTVVLLSAGSPGAVKAGADRLAHWMESEGGQQSLADVSYTLAQRRSHVAHRAAILASDRAQLLDRLRALAAGEPAAGVVVGDAAAAKEPHRPVWVFSGQGTQWQGMGRTLLGREPAFAAAVDELEPVIAAESGVSVRDLIASGVEVRRIDHVQPLIFAVQLALARAWQAHGVEPAAVIGHSMGEVAAAVVAGVLTPADGARVICRRSQLMATLGSDGAMATIGACEAEVRAELGKAEIAVITSPVSTVISGDRSEVSRIAALWDSRGVPAKLIEVDVASHSLHVDPILDKLRSALADLPPRPALVPMYTTVYDDPRKTVVCDADYWVANLRRPVRFAAAVQAAVADQYRVFVEVSPSPALVRPITEIANAESTTVTALPTLLRNADETEAFLLHLAALHCAGGCVDWSRLCPAGELVSAPTTTWERQPHQLPTTHRPGLAGPGVHPMLGTRVPVPGEQDRYLWVGEVGTDTHAWLADHRVEGGIVLPGAAYVELALAAATELFDTTPEHVELSAVEFLRLLSPAEATEVYCTATVTSPGRARFEVRTKDSGEWVTHASAELRHLTDTPHQPEVFPAGWADSYPDRTPPAELYRRLKSAGHHHGAAFAGVTAIRTSTTEPRAAASSVTLPGPAREHGGDYRLHPALLDSCLQTVAATAPLSTVTGLWLPAGLRRLQLHGDPNNIRACHTRVEDTEEGLSATIVMVDDEGRVLGVLDGLRLIQLAEPDPVASLADRLFEITWEPAPLPSGTSDQNSRWLAAGAPHGSDLTAGIVDALTARGARCELADIGTVPAVVAAAADEPYQGLVLCVADLTEADEGLDLICRLLALVRSGTVLPRLRIVTRGARAVRPEELGVPATAAVRGLVRVLMAEHPELRPHLLDLDPGTPLTEAATELLGDGSEDEVAWRDGTRYVARLSRAPLRSSERSVPSPGPVRYGHDGFVMTPTGTGTPDGVNLMLAPRRAPGPGEVEVQVLATSVNFRDLMIVLGVYEGDGEGPLGLGGDFAGVVTALGTGETGFRVGDRVVGCLVPTSWASFVTVRAESLALVPTGMSAAAAATVPNTYVTAWYGLCELGKLGPGETVLIHSAAGGVGLAAIAVARARGAQILATAGSESKRAYLRELGIEHVMDSRNLDFAEQAREATQGRGVDVVLNSLAGPALSAGVKALAPGGRFIEIGKRDLWANTQLGLRPFLNNLTFASLDLLLLANQSSPALLKTWQAVMAEVHAGRLEPLPHQEVPLDDAERALRTMAAAEHIGRLVLTLSEDGQTTAMPQPRSSGAVRPGGAYVITGGLGGLGLEAARWLAGHGAGRIVLNGRREPGLDALAIIEELRSHGTEVRIVLGDIAAPDTADTLVTAAGPELAGLLHSAVVLDDGIATQLTDDRVTRVWRPKVDGALHLHTAVADQPLDWFVLFSSASALLGNPGQANYAAANAWLDAFAVWRDRQGKRTLAVNWGAWGQAGRAQNMAERGHSTITTAEGFTALEQLLTHGRTSAGMLPLDLEQWLRTAPEQLKSSFYTTLLTESSERHAAADQDDILTVLHNSDSEAARRRALQTHLLDVLRLVLRSTTASIAPDRPFTDFGMDSLMFVELRNRLSTELGVTVPLTAISAHPSAAALAGYLSTLLPRTTEVTATVRKANG